jgi:hypothetical protein
LKFQVLKNRDGETANGLLVNVDYATCHFTTKSSLSGLGDYSFGSSEGGLDTLLQY